MSTSANFRNFAAANNGNRYKFSQRSNLDKIGAQASPGMCQALVFFDGLMALSGLGPERTNKRDVTEFALHFQQDFEAVRGAAGFVPATLRAKYLECLGYLEYTNLVRIGYVLNVATVGELTAFVGARNGHFNLLLPSHVVGFYTEGADHRYIDPNFGTVSFPSRADGLAFINSYHGCADFRRDYDCDVGDTMIVQMSNA